ncbi:TPA: hypothetical protein ACGO8V_002330 [Streptococcus suis]
MIISTSQIELLLNNKALPAYSLEKETGVSRDTISKFRRGEISLDNLTLKTLTQLQKWIDGGNFRISYDYSELIEDIKMDMYQGLIDEYIYIIRGEFLEALGTSPIVDYLCSLDELEEGEVAEKTKVQSVLAEMELYNKIF